MNIYPYLWCHDHPLSEDWLPPIPKTLSHKCIRSILAILCMYKRWPVIVKSYGQVGPSQCAINCAMATHYQSIGCHPIKILCRWVWKVGQTLHNHSHNVITSKVPTIMPAQELTSHGLILWPAGSLPVCCQWCQDYPFYWRLVTTHSKNLIDSYERFDKHCITIFARVSRQYQPLYLHNSWPVMV